MLAAVAELCKKKNSQILYKSVQTSFNKSFLFLKYKNQKNDDLFLRIFMRRIHSDYCNVVINRANFSILSCQINWHILPNFVTSVINPDFKF